MLKIGKNLAVLGWRDVPFDSSVLGSLSGDFRPSIKQLFLQAKPNVSSAKTQDDFEKLLYETRREIQGNFRKSGAVEGGAYVCSMSSKTIVYKGMLRSCDLPRFYKDLENPLYKSVFASYHRRFSTNTVPKWYLAQVKI